MDRRSGKPNIEGAPARHHNIQVDAFNGWARVVAAGESSRLFTEGLGSMQYTTHDIQGGGGRTH